VSGESRSFSESYSMISLQEPLRHFFLLDVYSSEISALCYRALELRLKLPREREKGEERGVGIFFVHCLIVPLILSTTLVNNLETEMYC